MQATPYKAPTFGGVTSDPAAGQTGSNDLQQDRPDTMQGWQSKIGGMSRLEKDQQYPGMHTDLIPAYEMITGGDPNWGMEGANKGPDSEVQTQSHNPYHPNSKGEYPRPLRPSAGGRKSYTAYAGPGSWGSWVSVGSIWSPKNSTKTEVISYRSNAQAKSKFLVEVKFDRRTVKDWGPGSSRLTIRKNSVSGVKIRCKSLGFGQAITGEYSGPGR